MSNCQALDNQSLEFNDLIDNEVTGIQISYEELKAKYAKGDNGFFQKIFNGKDERVFLKYLHENTDIDIKGLKQDNIFSTYTGVWNDTNEGQYFVGRTHGYQSKQNKGSQMKKIVIHFGAFNAEEFFELLNVDFIRYKELM